MKRLIKSNIFLQSILCIVLLIGIFALYRKAIDVVLDKKTIEREVSEDCHVMRCVNQVYEKENELILSGWVLRMGSVNKTLRIMLRDVVTGALIVSDASMSDNLKISRYYSETWDYGKIAFKATFNQYKIQENRGYEIIISLSYELPDVADRKYVNVSSNRYLYNGQIYEYNPMQFIKPVIQNAQLMDVIEKGELCLYVPDETLYIYKYLGELYWIAGENFSFASNNRTHISYHIGTSEIEKLPEHRREYKFDNLDFYFEDKEYILNNERFRVAVVAIPTDYPVTHFSTGVYDDSKQSMIWFSYFYPSVIAE